MAMRSLVSLALLMACSQDILLTSVEALTQADLALVEASFQDFLFDHEQLKAVRLSFHDCVGGCNGCLNLNNPDNAGLEGIVTLLDEAYETYQLAEVISRADYWAYAAVYSLKDLAETMQERCDRGGLTGVTCEDLLQPNVTFQWGRVDCSTAPENPDNSFEPTPSANMDHQQTLDYFAEEFGFTANEVVALLGVHTWGHAHIENSGFRGPWVEGEANHFNNGYFRMMSNETLAWEQITVNKQVNLQYQWVVRNTAFMLNCDMALYKNIQLDEIGESSCSYQDCGRTSTTKAVKRYANNNKAWVRDFSAVFTKMLAHGSDQLFDVEP